MHILLLLLAVPVLFAAILVSLGRPRPAGWVLVGSGVCLLAHAGVSIALIAANHGVVPAYVNFWLLAATVPAGVLLVLGGGAFLCVRACAVRLSRHR